MRRDRQWVWVGPLAAALLTTGCTLTSIRSGETDGPPEPYSATRLDASILIDDFSDVPESYRPSASERMLAAPLFLIDGLLSIVPETALLPVDWYYRRREQADWDFWCRFFEDDGELPTVEDMRRHLTKYSLETVRWRARSDLPGNNTMGLDWLAMGGTTRVHAVEPLWVSPCVLDPSLGMGMIGDEEPGTPGELDDNKPESARSETRRHDRLDRLIDAGIALDAVAGRPDITRDQIDRVLCLAWGQKAVHLALLRNPSTPSKLVELLLRRPGRAELRAVACNPQIPPAWARRIARRADDDAACCLAGNPSVSESVLADLDAKGEEQVREVLACRGDLPDSYALRYVEQPNLALTLIQQGRADLSAEVLLRALDSFPERNGVRAEVLNAMPRQRNAPRHILAMAWNEDALTLRDIQHRPNLPQYCFDAMASAVTDAREFNAEAVEALVPRVGISALVDLRERVAAQQAQAGTDYQILLSAIDARISNLRVRTNSGNSLSSPPPERALQDSQ